MSLSSAQLAHGGAMTIESASLSNATLPMSSSPSNPPPPSVASDNKAMNPDVEYKDVLISELWDLAYEKIRKEDMALVEKYEANLQGSLAAGFGSVLGSKVSRREWVNTILKHKREEVGKNMWKLKFGSHEVKAAEIAQPVLKIIKLINDSITTAMIPSPYASLAWTGINALVLVLLNPVDQAASLAKGLEYIACLISQSRMREELYCRRYDGQQSDYIHSTYKSALGHLYHEILKFQVTCYCYYSQSKTKRFGNGLIKRYNWDDLVKQIEPKEQQMAAISDIWRDQQYAEECAAAEKRHQETTDDLAAIGADLSGLRELVENANKQGDWRDFLRWLCDIDPSVIYNTARNKHEVGTGEWLTRGNESFKTWMESPRALLWLHGKAGAGKSMLSSSVIQHLQKKYEDDPLIAVAYYYFSFSDKKKQSRDGMLESLIKQICACRPDTFDAVKELKECWNKDLRPSTEILEKSFITTVCGFSAVYVVIDALDECPELDGREELMKTFRYILKNAPQKLHVFCTSRKETDIDAELRCHLSKPERIEIDLSLHLSTIENDMELYIDSTLTGTSYKNWPDTTKEEVKEKLIKKADGMFQYLRCQFEALRNIKLVSEINKALDDLPKGLDETYAAMLERIDEKHQSRVINCLKWLAFSVTPLTVDELAEIFIIRPENRTVIDENEGHFLCTDDVLVYFSGLITTEETYRQRYVRLAHFSIKEYLTSGRARQQVFSFSETDAHLFIASSCLAYHIHLSNLDGIVDGETYKLKHYAATRWGDHLEMVPLPLWPNEVLDKVARCLAARSRSLLNMIHEESYGSGNYFRFSATSILERPHCYVAWRGFIRLTELLLSPKLYMSKYLTQNDLDASLYEAVASTRGSKEVVSFLLSQGANMTAITQLRSDTSLPNNAFQAAAFRRDTAIMTLLLDHGVDIDAQRGELDLALQNAAEYGHLDMLKLLIERGADVDMCEASKEKRTALYKAASREQWEVFDLLLERSAQGDPGGHGTYTYPLLRLIASGSGRFRDFHQRFSLIKRLLELGADPNARDEDSKTAIYLACGNVIHAPGEAVQVVQLLIDHGADVNMVGGEYGTALQECAVFGRVPVAELLLKNGAIVGTQAGKYGDALQAACRGEKKNDYSRDNLAMIRLLLDHGAAVNAVGGKYGTALQAAIISTACAEEKAYLLLGRGANVNVQGGEYGNALQAACAPPEGLCSREYVEIVHLLLDSGAAANTIGGRYGTALRALCVEPKRVGHFIDYETITDELITIALLLLERGADVNAQGGQFGTALQAACLGSSINIVQLLLEHGADINISDSEYGTALQAACSRVHPDINIIQLLLDRGADCNISGGKYGTALQAACAFPQLGIEVIRLLLDYGANILEPGGEYGNAWNAAVATMEKFLAQNGYLDTTVLQLLLDHGANVDQVVNESGSTLHYVLSQKFFLNLFSKTRYPTHRPTTLDLEKGWISIIYFLLDNNAGINLRGGMYDFPIQAVCAIEYHKGDRWQMDIYALWINEVPKVVEILLLHDRPSVDINACGGIFGTALQAAAYSGQTKSVHLLLKEGAHVACNDRCGKYRSALNAAVVKGHWDIVDILLKAGAKPDCHLQPEIDEEWLAQVREEDGQEAEARYRKFWEVEYEQYWQVLLERGRHVAYYHFITALLLFRIQMFIHFMISYADRLKGSNKK